MQWQGPPRAPQNNHFSHLPPNDLRHRTQSRFPTFPPQNFERMPIDGVQNPQYTQRDPSRRPPWFAQAPIPSGSGAGVLHVNVGPSFRQVTYDERSTPKDRIYSSERNRHPRYRSRSPRQQRSTASSGRSPQCSPRRSRSASYSDSRSRTRSPYLSRSRSRSPRSKSRRRGDRSHPSPRRRSRSRRTPSPVSSRSSRLSSRSVSRAPNNATKPSVPILQYFGVKVRNVPHDLLSKHFQSTMRNRFKDYGIVLSIVASYDRDTRFAVVMFNSADAQARAVEASGLPLLGKHLEVTALSSEMTRNCYGVKVTCPTKSLDEHVLYAVFDFFKKYGVVVAVKLYDGHIGRFAVFKFERRVEQTRALEASGTFIRGYAIKVSAMKMRHSKRTALDHVCKKSRSKLHVDKRNLHSMNNTNQSPSDLKNDESPSCLSEEMDRSQPRESRMLFVRNLDTNITKQELLKTFERFGEVVDVYVNRLPGSARQFAFLQFSLAPSVTSAILAMNGAFLGTCQITLSYGVIEPSKCVCVEGLSTSLTHEYLIQRFGEHGAIEKLLYDKTKGSALILYAEEHASRKAVNITRSFKVTGEKVVLDYANESFQLHFCQSLLASDGLHAGKT